LDDLHVGRTAEPAGGRLSRRRVLRAGAAGGLAAAVASATGRHAQGAAAQSDGATPVAGPTADWAAFDAAVQEATATFEMVGAAVAVVTADGIAHGRTFGVRDLANGAPVTPETHFMVASTTKSMSSLLVATYVDDGALAWDQPAREVWPDFRTPTEELTARLRVRDLLGMGSGIGEPAALSGFHEGDPTALELLQSVVNLPIVDDRVDGAFFYNNTVYAVGGYLPALVEGTAADDLEAVYERQMAERVFRPAAMSTARIADDPRPFVENYATGYGSDFVLGTAAEAYGPVGSYAPVGGTTATLTDMANYVALQLRGGISVAGTRVVSAANLAACWQPHVAVPTSPTLDPDATSAGYGMGWISVEYTDGRRLVWHNGGIDGFATHIAFLPEENLGLVILTNVGPEPRSISFTTYVQNLLLSSRFGLNWGANPAVVDAYRAAADGLDQLAAQADPVDPAAAAPYLGHYEKGWSLGFAADGSLRLRLGPRSFRMMAMPDGSYVMASGYALGQPVDLTRDENGMPRLAIRDFETVNWTVGPA
jgi:CubicO group peptidase (beta-lactamase class C family)